MNTFIDRATQDILELHALIESWYGGESNLEPAELERVVGHLHPDFIMIAAAGRKHGREALAKRLQDRRGSLSGLDISIVDLDLLYATPELAIFTYENQRRWEHHFQRRISTAVFTRAEDGRPQWLHLQETLVEDE